METGKSIEQTKGDDELPNLENANFENILSKLPYDKATA